MAAAGISRPAGVPAITFSAGIALLLLSLGGVAGVESMGRRVAAGASRASGANLFSGLPPVCQRLLSRRLHVPEYPPIEGRPHKFRMRLPTKGQYGSLCVPQKNGNRSCLRPHPLRSLALSADISACVGSNQRLTCAVRVWRHRYWSGLAHASVHRVPVKIRGEWNPKGLQLGQDASGATIAYLLARNPYIRALSLYLDKVRSSCLKSSGSKRAMECNQNVYNYRNGKVKLPTPPKKATFEEYMQFVDEQFKQHGSMCKINYPQHACLQTSICLEPSHSLVFLLKTEEQDLWYPCMVQYLELGSVMSSPGWRTFTGKHCFHHPAGKTCEQALELPSKAALLAGSKDATLATGTLHATSAWSRLYDHYTSAAAEIVTRLYAKDFEILNYPTWDGIGNFSVNFPFETAQSYR
mmetsp:Transcript_16403/g.42026  ORF Transcript_16403/g.42026 Transcript_16403/m.42026 type:complete len:410 (-) Transcript_16403:214-1443(-)